MPVFHCHTPPVVSQLHPPIHTPAYAASPAAPTTPSLTTGPYKSHHCLDHRRVLVPTCTFTALPLASQRPNPHPTHTRNVNNTTSPHQYRYKISRRHSQDFPSHKPKLHARSRHRVPFTPPTTGHLPYLPGSSKNPPSTFSPLPIFTDRSSRISVGVSY